MNIEATLAINGREGKISTRKSSFAPVNQALRGLIPGIDRFGDQKHRFHKNIPASQSTSEPTIK
ncbi:MAG: hypothetical protein WCJ19_03700 [bacterium]